MTELVMDQENTVVLIDGEYLMRRSMHQPNLAKLSRPSDGLPTGTLLGFLNSLQRLYKVYGRGIAVAWEGGGASMKRQKLYEHYKGNRVQPEQKGIEHFERGDAPEMDDRVYIDLYRDLIRTALHHLNVPCGYAPDREADDVLATWAKRVQQANPQMNVIVYTRDKDLWQVVSDRCRVVFYKDAKEGDAVIDLARIKEEYVEPLGVVWEKVLRGDSSDFIPGVEFNFPNAKGDDAKPKMIPPRQIRKILERRPQTFDALCRVLSEMQRKGEINKHGFSNTSTTLQELRRNYQLVKLDEACDIRPCPPNERLLELLPDIETLFREFAFTRLASNMKLWTDLAARAPFQK